MPGVAPPYTDLMAATDAACAHPRIDETRTAAMGGSFGGYMANWIAGHTDRFEAIVTHASLWALDQFGADHRRRLLLGARDDAGRWPKRTRRTGSSSTIATPMLVIHGDKDYRVPIGEGLRLWYELLTESGLPAADDGSVAAPVPVLPDREPLGARAAARQDLVPGGHGVPGRARARREPVRAARNAGLTIRPVGWRS